jgi:hypothetical protein
MHRHTALGKRDADSAGADAELERAPATGQADEESTTGSTASGVDISAVDSS